MAKAPKKNAGSPAFDCPFCDKTYKTENGLLKHKCEKRDRYNDRDSRQVRTGLNIWLQFMETYHIQIKQKVDPMMQFIKSKYFNDFYNFAVYVIENQILHKDDFITEVLTSGKPSYEWRSPQVYKDWVLKVTRNEHPLTGLERSISSIQEWSVSTGNDWTDFFELVSTDRALLWIETGQISPWFIYIAPKESGDKLLTRFSPEEGKYLMDYLNPLVWTPLTIRYKNDVHELRELLKEYGI